MTTEWRPNGPNTTLVFDLQPNSLFINNEILLYNMDEAHVPFGLTFEEVEYKSKNRGKKEKMLIAKLAKSLESWEKKHHDGGRSVEGEYVKEIDGEAHYIKTTDKREEAMKILIWKDRTWDQFVILAVDQGKKKHDTFWAVIQGGINTKDIYEPDGCKWSIDYADLNKNEYTGLVKMINRNHPNAKPPQWEIEIESKDHEHIVILRESEVVKGQKERRYIKKLSKQLEYATNRDDATKFYINKTVNGHYTLQYENNLKEFYTHIRGNSLMYSNYARGASEWTIEKI